MKLDVSDLIRKNKTYKEVHVELKDSEGFFDGTEKINYFKVPKLNGEVSISDNVIVLDGKLQADLKLTCSRCLEKFHYPIDMNIQEQFVIDDPSNEDNDDLIVINGDVIDITKVIENNIIVQLPIKRLCKEDCKGLCQKCGANLNVSECNCETLDVDPRLAKLKDFFSNN